MSTTTAEASLYFPGYLRADCLVGIRNHLAIVGTAAQSKRIAQVVMCITSDFERGLQTPDARLQDQVIEQLIPHPKLGAAVVLCHDRQGHMPGASGWPARKVKNRCDLETWPGGKPQVRG